MSNLRGLSDALEELAAEMPFLPATFQRVGKLRAVRDAVGDRLLEHLDLKALAREAGLTPSHLSYAFRKEYGVSISQFRRQVRLQRTFETASRRGLPLYEAAAECGFYDASHFYRAGVQELGLRPSEVQSLLSEKSKSRTRHFVPT